MQGQARLDSPGTLHHVMVRGIEKRRIVDDEMDRRTFVRRLGALAEETGTPIYASVSLTPLAKRESRTLGFRRSSREFCPSTPYSLPFIPPSISIPLYSSHIKLPPFSRFPEAVERYRFVALSQPTRWLQCRVQIAYQLRWSYFEVACIKRLRELNLPRRQSPVAPFASQPKAPRLN